jgi:hypothetical protein
VGGRKWIRVTVPEVGRYIYIMSLLVGPVFDGLYGYYVGLTAVGAEYGPDTNQ